MAKEQRFERIYSQGTLTITEIWVDRETGVNYVFHTSGNAGGMTPLLDREGKTCHFSHCKPRAVKIRGICPALPRPAFSF